MVIEASLWAMPSEHMIGARARGSDWPGASDANALSPTAKTAWPLPITVAA
jgi:hypothetical protein